MNEEIREFIELSVEIVSLSEYYNLQCLKRDGVFYVELEYESLEHWCLVTDIHLSDWKQTLTNLLQELKRK